MIDHPHEPVPTSIIRPAMEYFSDFVVDRLTDTLNLAMGLTHDEPTDEQREPEQPDSLPEIGT